MVIGNRLEHLLLNFSLMRKFFVISHSIQENKMEEMPPINHQNVEIGNNSVLYSSTNEQNTENMNDSKLNVCLKIQNF